VSGDLNGRNTQHTRRFLHAGVHQLTGVLCPCCCAACVQAPVCS
jgi:hypothetical protein